MLRLMKLIIWQSIHHRRLTVQELLIMICSGVDNLKNAVILFRQIIIFINEHLKLSNLC